MAERIRPAHVADLTRLSVRKVQELAAAGRIPGAAKLGGVWTFDPGQVRAWIKQEEQKVADRADRKPPVSGATRMTSSGGAATALSGANSG